MSDLHRSKPDERDQARADRRDATQNAPAAGAAGGATSGSMVGATPEGFGPGDRPLRLVVCGLSHGHAGWLLDAARRRDDIEIVGVWEPDRTLADRYAGDFGLDLPRLWSADLGEVLDRSRAEAGVVMTSTRGHGDAVEQLAARGLHVMVEKPLAVSASEARRMAGVCARAGVHLVTNFETSWYAGLREAHALTRRAFAPITRAVFSHGHPGPIVIGCQPEFVDWLIDPVENGGGAMMDFGCYGVALMTWLMDGQRPSEVLATHSTQRPGEHPRVDDDSTILLTYANGATGVVQGSWCWPHPCKSAEIYSQSGAVYSAEWDRLSVRSSEEASAHRRLCEPLPQGLRDPWTYLRELSHGRVAPDVLGSPELNITVCEVLDAARLSALQGRRVDLVEGSSSQAASSQAASSQVVSSPGSAPSSRLGA